jgi:hypothetical protein
MTPVPGEVAVRIARKMALNAMPMTIVSPFSWLSIEKHASAMSELARACACVLALDAARDPIAICRDAIVHRLAHQDTYELRLDATVVDDVAAIMASTWERELSQAEAAWDVDSKHNALAEWRKRKSTRCIAQRSACSSSSATRNQSSNRRRPRLSKSRLPWRMNEQHRFDLPEVPASARPRDE